MTKADGSRLDIELLRPAVWVELAGAQPGQTIELDLPELGAEGPAAVLAVEPCPPIQGGPGQLVTGTFAHQSADVLDLHVAGLDEPLGVTAGHPFWSDDRQDFVPAGMLRAGERLAGLDGPARVASIVPRASPQRVYNLEVDTEHVYCVPPRGLLVHNNCPGGGIIRNAVRNIWGRLGGPAHRARVLAVQRQLESKGWTRLITGKARFENGYRVASGKMRFPDLVMKRGNELVAVQVGKRTLGLRIPVWRERQALQELRNSGFFRHVFYVSH
jgi:hypothetical protein